MPETKKDNKNIQTMKRILHYIRPPHRSCDPFPDTVRTDGRIDPLYSHPHRTRSGLYRRRRTGRFFRSHGCDHRDRHLHFHYGAGSVG